MFRPALLALATLALATLVPVTVAYAADVTQSCTADPQCTVSFPSAAESTWTVPDGITSATVTLAGGSGGDGDLSSGGAGGQLTATIAVTSGDVLTGVVGDRGADEAVDASRMPAFGGGGLGGADTADSSPTYGAGGDPATLPTVRCSARDWGSGLAACTLTKVTVTYQDQHIVQYNAKGTDKAGNTSTFQSSIAIAPYGIVGATYSKGTYVLRRQHTYKIAALSTTKPHYLAAVRYPHMPTHLGAKFHRSGKIGSTKRWTLSLRIGRHFAKYKRYNLGITTGDTHMIKVRIN